MKSLVVAVFICGLILGIKIGYALCWHEFEMNVIAHNTSAYEKWFISNNKEVKDEQ